MKILSLHPRYLSDETINAEHDFLHSLLDALSDEDAEAMEHPDFFRYNGRRGQLYIRHRMLAEEMLLRAMSHTTMVDRRLIEADEWKDPDIPEKEILGQADEHKGGAGRVPLTGSEEIITLTGENDMRSVVVGVLELDVLKAFWKIYSFLVMERSYSRYRTLADPIKGKGRGQVWFLFDLMMEEAFASEPEDRAPAIAYETMWEMLEAEATGEESGEYERLTGLLEPGKVSIEMRKFLAESARRQDNDELVRSGLLAPYLL